MGHQLVDDPHNQGTDMTTTDAFTGTYAGIDDLTVTLDGGVLAYRAAGLELEGRRLA